MITPGKIEKVWRQRRGRDSTNQENALADIIDFFGFEIALLTFLKLNMKIILQFFGKNLIKKLKKHKNKKMKK